MKTYFQRITAQQSVFRQITLAGRGLLRDIPFTLLAITILTLGLAANISIFSVLQAVLLQPLPYPEPEQLLSLSSQPPDADAEGTRVASQDFLDWRDQAKTLDDLSAYVIYSAVLTGLGEPESLNAAAVVPGFFSVLGLPPHLGRVFTPEDGVFGRNDFAILSHSLWQQRFGSDPDVIGKTLHLDDELYRIVGVSSPHHEIPSRRIQIYLPLAFTEAGTNRHTLGLTAIGRRQPKATLEQVRSEVGGLAQRLAEQYPKTNAGRTTRVIPLHEWRVGNVQPALQALQIAAGFLLLMICTNLASLLLARVVAKQKDIAMHRALGATSWTLAKRALLEISLLALAAFVLALPLAVSLMKILVAASPDQLPRIEQASVNSSVLLFSIVLTMVTVLLCGLLPAVHSGRSTLQGALRGRPSSLAPGKGRIAASSTLVIGQIALALCLLIGTGLLLRSLARLESQAIGFDSNRVLVVQLSLPAKRYAAGESSTQFLSQLLEQIETLPTSLSAGAVSGLPFQGGVGDFDVEYEIEGRAEEKAVRGQRIASIRIATPHYFKTLGIPLVAGRGLEDRDRPDQPLVAVINQTLARRLDLEQHLGQQSTSSLDTDSLATVGEDARPRDQTRKALGQRLKVLLGSGRIFEVVGVVGDTHYEGFEQPPKPELFLSFRQIPTQFASVVIRTRSDPMASLPLIQERIWQLDPEQPILRALSMDQLVARSVAERRFHLRLVSSFGAVALILAALGIYGLMARRVASQRQEIGVRLALGAKRQWVRRQVLGQALALTGFGLALGGLLVALFGRLLEGLLFGVSSMDLLTFSGACLTLTAAAALGSYLPALRASRIDPATTLRLGN